jgi:dephospho-CoA kinase
MQAIVKFTKRLCRQNQCGYKSELKKDLLNKIAVIFMNEKAEKTVYFITGASGVGKTTLLNNFQHKYENMPWAFLHFDSIGVPSPEEMIKEFGSPSRWQQVKTQQWVKKIIKEYTYTRIFFEGQVNLEFIREAFEKESFENYKIILVDCEEKEMAHRLVYERNQPHLLTADMKNWLSFLRNQAAQLNVPVINTSLLSEQEALNKFEKMADIFPD